MLRKLSIIVGLLTPVKTFAQTYGEGAYGASAYQSTSSSGGVTVGPISIGPGGTTIGGITLPITGSGWLGIGSVLLIAIGVGVLVWRRQKVRSA